MLLDEPPKVADLLTQITADKGRDEDQALRTVIPGTNPFYGSVFSENTAGALKRRAGLVHPTRLGRAGLEKRLWLCERLETVVDAVLAHMSDCVVKQATVFLCYCP